MTGTTLATYCEDIPMCPICQSQGNVLYHNLLDRFIPNKMDKWHFDKCIKCGHIWLTPRFAKEYIDLAYEGYSDLYWSKISPYSSASWKQALKSFYFAVAYGYPLKLSVWQKFMGYFLYVYPPVKARFDRQVRFLAHKNNGKLLDVGSGEGWFLQNMQWLGWDVEGVDIDPISAEKARERGIPIRLGTLEEQQYPNETFDVITMAHVIEHLHDPVETLQECFRILKTGGKIVLFTPNAESLAHSQFLEDWQPLEHPRHLNLFTLHSMAKAVEKAEFKIERLSSLADGAYGVWLKSLAIKNTGYYQTNEQGTLFTRLRAHLFYMKERLKLLVANNIGEEIILIARK